MGRCSRCGSYAINHHLHGRNGSRRDLCDVCYWRDIAETFADDRIELLQQLAMAEDAANKGDKARKVAQSLVDEVTDLRAELALSKET